LGRNFILHSSFFILHSSFFILHSSELLALTDNFLVQTLINPANLDSLRLCAFA